MRHHQLAQFNQCQFHQQLLAAGIAIVQVTAVTQVKGTVIERWRQFNALLAIVLRHLIVHFEQTARLWRRGNHQVAQVLSQTVDEELRVKTLVTYFFIDKQRLVDITVQERIH